MKQGGMFFGMMRPGIEPRSPEPLANTLPSRPMSRFNNAYYYDNIYLDMQINTICTNQKLWEKNSQKDI